MTGVSTAPPPRPVALRPLAVLDLVDGAFAALRQRPRTMIAVVLPILVPLELLQAWLARDLLGGVGLAELWADPTLLDEDPGAGTGATGLPVVVDLAATSFTVAVAGVAIAHVMAGWLEGREVSAGQALAAVARRWWVVLAAWLLGRLVVLVASALFVLPGLVAIVLLSVISPVLAIEGRGPLGAIRRSVALVRPRLGPVLVLVALTGIVSYGVSQAIESLPSAVALIIGPSLAWPLLAVSGILGSLVVVPFVAASACLVYLDLRFRTEGFDLELEAAEVLPGAR